MAKNILEFRNFEVPAIDIKIQLMKGNTFPQPHTNQSKAPPP